ncbi:MAG: alpha/beta fold hydrolase [Vicingaceae bacterium]|nr:alpha/beta fold hydrolase [Vicingaceae bacterium]
MQHKITVNKTAFYHTLGDVKTAQTIWIVLHGYGYLAKYFIRKFNPILNENTAVIAPEGLSKFYLNGVGFDGRMGASWMTKDNREAEIEDYINYLDQLYKAIIEENETSDVKINVVGFSQGGATASRWIANQQSKIDNLILWASSFAEGIDLKLLAQNNKLFALFGDNDKYISKEKIDQYEAKLKAENINSEFIRFVGKHDIPADVLTEQTQLNNW